MNMRENGLTDNNQQPAEHEQWDRLSTYLEKLAHENDKLESDLANMRKKREAQAAAQAAASQPQPAPASAPVFTVTAYEDARDLNLHLGSAGASYEKLRTDARDLLSDFQSFRAARGQLESQLTR